MSKRRSVCTNVPLPIKIRRLPPRTCKRAIGNIESRKLSVDKPPSLLSLPNELLAHVVDISVDSLLGRLRLSAVCRRLRSIVLAAVRRSHHRRLQIDGSGNARLTVNGLRRPSQSRIRMADRIDALVQFVRPNQLQLKFHVFKYGELFNGILGSIKLLTHLSIDVCLVRQKRTEEKQQRLVAQICRMMRHISHFGSLESLVVNSTARLFRRCPPSMTIGEHPCGPLLRLQNLNLLRLSHRLLPLRLQTALFNQLRSPLTHICARKAAFYASLDAETRANIVAVCCVRDEDMLLDNFQAELLKLVELLPNCRRFVCHQPLFWMFGTAEQLVDPLCFNITALRPRQLLELVFILPLDRFFSERWPQTPRFYASIDNGSIVTVNFHSTTQQCCIVELLNQRLKQNL